jgi:hypothetical protein
VAVGVLAPTGVVVVVDCGVCVPVATGVVVVPTGVRVFVGYGVQLLVGYGVLVIHDVLVFVGCGVVVQLTPVRDDVAPTGVTIEMKSRNETNIEIGSRMLIG